MILHAVAVPVVPAVAWALVDLAVAVTFVVCLGLLWTWKRTIGSLFEWLGHKAISASVHGFGFTIHPFGFLLTLNEQAIGALDAAVAGTEHAMVYAFRRMVGAVLWTGQEISGLATDTYNAIKSMGHATTATVTKVVRETVVKPITKTVTIVKGTSAVITRQLTARISRLEHRVASMAHATAGAIATPFPRIGTVERDLSGLKKRVKSLEKTLAIGVGTALVVRTLAKLGLGCLTGRNGKKAVGSLCKIDPSTLDSLLLNALALSVAFNLEDFAKEMQAITSEAASLIHDWAT